MLDQDDIINSILNEETGLDLDYNKDKYKVNDILNEDTDKLLLSNESHETKEQPKDDKKNESEKKANDIPIEIKKEEKPIEPKKEIFKEAPSYLTNENDLLDAILNEPSSSIEIKKEEKKEEKIEEKKVEEKKVEVKKEEIKEVKKESHKNLSEEIIKKEMEKKNEMVKKEKDEQLKRDFERILEEEIKKKELEEQMKKKYKEEEKKIDNFYPPFTNPLDFIQYLEVDRINGQISNEMKNFILQNHRRQDNKYEVTEIVPLSMLSAEISKFDISAMLARINNLILCTKDGSILFYSIKDQILKKKIIPKNLRDSYINCLDITDDFVELICGYQDGTIALININTDEVKYVNNKIHKDCACIELKIYKKDKSEIHFISSGEDGQVFYHVLKIGIFSRLNSTPINIKTKTPIFMVKFITFSLENQRLYSNLKCLKKYVILGSLDFISLYCVEPLKEVFVIKKPNYIKESVVPDAQIGIGRPPEIVVRFAKKDEKNHLILIISWGKIIYFYQLPIVEGKRIEENKELGYYINLFNILRIGFMNNSVIYCLDKSFSIKVLDSAKINPGRITISNGQPAVPKNNSLAEIEKSRLVSANISSQKKFNLSFTEEDGNPKDSYLYTIVDNNASVISVVVLGEKQLYNVKLIDWTFFLNYLQKKEDFLNLFAVGIDLYKGKMMALSNIPEKKEKKKTIGEFLKQIVLQYVILNTGEKKTGGFFLEETEDKEKISYCIKMSIEFCIEIEVVDYLLKSIYPLFETKDYSELFLTRLQPFILCDKIIDIVLSSDIILNLIDLYNKNGKLDILSQMLLHVNIKSIDTKEIKKKLEEMNLITPLIYLYMNGENEDYFSPLEKMFDYFYTRAIPSKMLINEEDTIDYSSALTKKVVTPKEVRNCKEYCGHRILWYIRLCLTGKKFPDNRNKMNKILFDALVPKVTYWLLNPKVIEEFLNFDPKNYFMIFKNIFSIEDLYKKLVTSANDLKNSIEVKNTLSSSNIKIVDIKPTSLIYYLVEWCKKKKETKIFFYLYDFIISVLNVDKELGKDLKLESICYILKFYTQINKHINNQEVKTMNNNLIKILEKETKFTDEEYKKMLSSIEDKIIIFNEVKLYIYDKIDYCDKCLELYLNKDFNISGKTTKLFKWINDKLQKYHKGTYLYVKLIDSIKEHSLPLAALSLNKFYDLSREIDIGTNKDIILRLNLDKNVQLSFIEILVKYIIITYENNENNVTNEEMSEIKFILEMHIYLLCELNLHDKIIPSLKSCPFYPLPECLKYCENSKAYQPCLFLYLKEGSIEKAFEMANVRLNETFDKLIKTINGDNDDKEYTNLLNEFHKYLNDIKNICEYNELRLEHLWFQILKELYGYEVESKDLVNKYEFKKDKKKNADNLHDNISLDIKELMEKMISFVGIKRILDEVSEKNKSAGFKEFRTILMEILNSFSNLSNILSSAKNLLTNLVLQNEHYFQVLNLKGELLKANKCAKCQKPFNKNLNNKEKILVFSCEHVFHKECIYQGKMEYGKEYSCPICTELEFDQYFDKGKSSLIKENNSVIPEKNIKDNKFQVNLSVTARKALQKLERYDFRYLEKHKLMINNSITVLCDQYRPEYK